MPEMKSVTHDILNCLANLSNDEVFTPPELANKMIDLLPGELFDSTETTFLDPCCKSGVFLREIAKRLIDSKSHKNAFEKTLPDNLSEEEKHQKRLDHIYHKQLFGIAITQLTALMSRRTLYCSKYPNTDYSVSKFDDIAGNIRFERIDHTWDKNGKCKYCGASKSNYSQEARGENRETHAYEFIETDKPEELWGNMKFDVIIGNPPYQMSDGGNGVSAMPVYHKFVIQAKALEPRYITMIIPARWYTGGKGLDSFRDSMLNDRKIKVLVDYVNSKDCFDSLSISGGVCYFLWHKDYSGMCNYKSIISGKESNSNRYLNEFKVFIRYNEAVNIIHKVKSQKETTIDTILSSRNPFGIPTNARGEECKLNNKYKLFSSKGYGYISESEIKSNIEIASSYKVMITRVMSEHAGEPDKDGKLMVLATIKVLNPYEICTDSYIVGGCYNIKEEAEHLSGYLCTKFVRFLILQSASSINLSKSTYQFVPLQDFSKPWTDAELYEKYGLSQEEIDFIESMIKPME